MRRQLPIPLSLCLAAACAWPLGARAFLGPLPPCVLRAGLALAPLPRTARGRVTAACRLPLTLRAAADADADAELTKEQKLKKYQNLAVELITKAKKLPPGSASKQRYLMQARNAKAMADALGYSAEPVNPKQAALDAAQAYKEAKEKKEGSGAGLAAANSTAPAAVTDPATPVRARAKKANVQVQIASAQPEMAEMLTDVVNWAYRGKSGEQGWTGEMDFIDGIRISLEDMKKTLEGGEAAVLVAAAGEQLVGCVKIEPLDTGEAEIGMFAVDPDFQSCGVGRALLNAAHEFALEVLEVSETVMMVLDNRQDIIAWYESNGYQVTKETAPFPKGLNVGVPKRDLQFVRLRRRMPEA